MRSNRVGRVGQAAKKGVGFTKKNPLELKYLQLQTHYSVMGCMMMNRWLPYFQAVVKDFGSGGHSHSKVGVCVCCSWRLAVCLYLASWHTDPTTYHRGFRSATDHAYSAARQDTTNLDDCQFED